MIPETEVDYDDAKHLYHFKGERYLSSTQLVGLFKNKFDANGMSEYMVDRYSGTSVSWLKKWQYETDISIIRGNIIHNKKEDRMRRKTVVEYGDTTLPVIDKNQYPNWRYFSLPDGIYPELKIWSHKHKIAGRMDKAIFKTADSTDRPGKARYANIEDYKTNKSITDYSYGKMMLGVLSHIPDCKKSHMTLQLSIYQFMLEEHGFWPGSRTIIHFPHEIPDLGTPPPVQYVLPYWKDEVLGMLDCVKFYRNHAKELNHRT